MCKKLCHLFQTKMNEFVGKNSEWWYNGDGLHPNTERSTLLLLDRKDDTLSYSKSTFKIEIVHGIAVGLLKVCTLLFSP